jgi:hypothetical protein
MSKNNITFKMGESFLWRWERNYRFQITLCVPSVMGYGNIHRMWNLNTRMDMNLVVKDFKKGFW